MQSHSSGEDRMDWMQVHWGAVGAGSPFQTEWKGACSCSPPHSSCAQATVLSGRHRRTPEVSSGLGCLSYSLCHLWWSPLDVPLLLRLPMNKKCKQRFKRWTPWQNSSMPSWTSPILAQRQWLFQHRMFVHCFSKDKAFETKRSHE